MGGKERDEMSRGPGKQAEGVRDFGVTLSQIDYGAFIQELSDTQHQINDELAKHAQQRGKAKGTLTIVLAYEHDAKGVVSVSTEVKTKTPKADRSKTVFWTTDGGNLVNKDPKQMELAGIRDVSATSKAVQDAIGEGGIGIARQVV